MSESSSRGSSAGAHATGAPRYLEPDVRRQQILNAAATVFADRGFPAARISDIAAEAGVAQGTVYRFFTSKDEIASAIFALGQDECRAKLEELREQGAAAAPLQIVRDYVAWYARYLVRRRPIVVALFSWELDPAGRRGADIGNRQWVADVLDDLLAKAGVATTPAGIDLGRVVPLLVYSLTALADLYQVSGAPQPEEALAASIADLMWRFLESADRD
jgi:AcrR family transcriptional regulator